MRHANEERRHALGSLSKLLQEFAAARRDLIHQLEDLDARARVVQQVHNALHNADVPISSLPDEIITMVFEEGMRQEHQFHHFGTLVSQVSHRWREIALANPGLWTSIRVTVGADDPGDLRERAATFLSRAMSSPLKIYIRDRPGQNFSYALRHTWTALLQLIDKHMGHCQQLRIATSDDACLIWILRQISSQHMPILRSIDLFSQDGILFEEPIFPFGAPRLKMAQLRNLYPRTMRLCLPAFGSVTALRLTYTYVSGAVEYTLFRDGLMALSSLAHFEIELRYFFPPPDCLPTVLPTIQFLHLDVTPFPECLGKFMGSLRVPSLSTLSLQVGDVEPKLTGDSLEHFPPLQHLIFTNFTSAFPSYKLFARKFSGIERLTYTPTSEYSYYDPADAFRDVDGGLQWPSVRTLAMSTPDEDSDALWLFWHNAILEAQVAGHPIRKVMLPQTAMPKAAGAMVKMRELLEIEAFHVDWPTPFQGGPE